MKTLATIKNLRNKMFQAERAYRQAIIKNLKEMGEALPVDCDDHDEDEPKGVRVTSINGNGDDCYTAIVDAIRYDDKEAVTPISVHVSGLDDDNVDLWWGITDLDESAADYVLDAIVWPEGVYPDYYFEKGVIRHTELEKAIIGKDYKRFSDIIYSERPILYSVVYNDGNSVILADNLRKAKELARRICKETKGEVSVNHHSPFEVWREYITVYYESKRLRWNYLTVGALDVKDY